MKHIELFVDGACSGNPGPGGWAALLRFRDQEKLISGGETLTTNNRMELMAAIEGLKLLTEECEITLTTDSEYVRQGITCWIEGWQKKGWRTASNQPVKNIDLWQQLLEQTRAHKIHWHWVKGHSGHIENDRVDEAARNAAQKFKCV